MVLHQPIEPDANRIYEIPLEKSGTDVGDGESTWYSIQ
jgi:hypothetical protein